MEILITGGTGKLGTALKSVFPEASYPDRKELDIEKRTYTGDKTPYIIIHAAAATSVEWCEENQERAYEINALGTAWLKKKFPSSYLIYISTACVFDGETGGYSEYDEPNPTNWYGTTKLEGERFADLVVRTNFVTREKWPYPKAFTDRFGTYLFADDVAKAIKDIIFARKRGVIHVCGKEILSMYDLAQITTPGILPMTLADYTGKAKLTKNMTLITKRWTNYQISY